MGEGRTITSGVRTRSAGAAGRVVVVAAVAGAIALVALLLFDGGGYSVDARFLNAGQLVEGNLVQIGGTQVGTVEGIEITGDGQAQVSLSIDGEHSPLPVGTRAAIRQFSQSGSANRYVKLELPPRRAGREEAEIPDGGEIGAEDTETAVDLDELFNTLDPGTRRSLRRFFKGSAEQLRAVGEEANAGLRYLNPALATTSRLFRELSRDTPALERFLVDSSRLVTALADRREELASLVGDLDTTMTALGASREDLTGSIELLPPVMRRANTTFVNLRAALDDVDPLVAASKPVARRLDPFLDQARPFAAASEPTVADLRTVARRRGAGNDLLELIRALPPLADIGVDTLQRSVDTGGQTRDVGERQGALPEAAEAFRAGAEPLSIARPYTPDFLGWLDDFSTTGGGYDALGAYARGHIVLSESLGGLFQPVRRGQYKRCPGASEEAAGDGSNVLSEEERARLDCDESARATGAVE